MTDFDLFADFDPATIRAIAQQEADARQSHGRARAVRTQGRHEMRRANAEKTLAELLPPVFAPGDTWDVISRGDIDALSYLRHVLAGVPFLDTVVLSTWCIARPDMEELRAWLDSGRIETLHLAAGEIFPNQYGDEYEMAQALVRDYGARLTIAKNHSKVTLASHAVSDYWVSMRSSANVNTNPRIEQTVISNNRELFDFYLGFFDGLKSIDRATSTRHAG